MCWEKKVENEGGEGRTPQGLEDLMMVMESDSDRI